jgi:transcriptional regulator with GAF, ATPase, and Fis domain
MSVNQTQRMLASMAIELEEKREPQQMIEKVSDYARVLLDADEAGILVTHSRHDIETPAATGPVVAKAHDLQTAFDEGPCLDAIEGRATYLTGDTAHDERWPKWGPAAFDIGVKSAVGVRLATRGRGYGSLNVYANRLNAFDQAQADLVEVLAAHASAAFAAADRERGLAEALESRTIIGQAQGILMQTFNIDADTAFSFLRRISQHENVRLHALAEAISVQRDANARPEN